MNEKDYDASKISEQLPHISLVFEEEGVTSNCVKGFNLCISQRLHLFDICRAMEEDYYHVRVTVDGVKIPADLHCAGNSNACRFRVRILRFLYRSHDC